MTLTRRGRLVVGLLEIGALSGVVVALLAGAVVFGVTHPGRCAWAIPVLGLALLVLALVWLLRNAPRLPAERSHLDDLDLPTTDRTPR